MALEYLGMELEKGSRVGEYRVIEMEYGSSVIEKVVLF